MNKNTEDQIAYIAKFQFDELMRSPKDMVTVDLWKKRVFPSDIELCSSALVREDERKNLYQAIRNAETPATQLTLGQQNMIKEALK